MSSVEYDRLRGIEDIVKEMFLIGEKEGLYIGLGRLSGLPDVRELQEGKKVTQLRKLIFPECTTQKK